MTDFQGASAQFLQAWNDYLLASQKVLERLGNPHLSSPAPALPYMDAWLNLAKGFGLQSGLNALGVNMEEAVAKLAPNLGYAREHQQIAQRMMELAADFERRYREWTELGSEITESAMRAVQQRAAKDPTLSATPAASYEAWIESAEAAYAQAAHSEPFARTLGDLCNILSAFKVERGRLLETLARHLDLPSRAEVDSLHRQIAELKRAARADPARKAPAAKPRTRKTRRPAP